LEECTRGYLHETRLDVELVDAKAIKLPILDRMQKGIPEGAGACRSRRPRAYDPRRRRLRLRTGEYN
jgi:hypothetical protein